MGLSVWRETSKKLTVYRVCYTPIETLTKLYYADFDYFSEKVVLSISVSKFEYM